MSDDYVGPVLALAIYVVAIAGFLSLLKWVS